jgi:hypothetical protein
MKPATSSADADNVIESFILVSLDRKLQMPCWNNLHLRAAFQANPERNREADEGIAQQLDTDQGRRSSSARRCCLRNGYARQSH